MIKAKLKDHEFLHASVKDRDCLSAVVKGVSGGGLDTSDATATASDIKAGETAYVKGEKITGTHVCDAGLDTSDATASASDISSGKTAYVNGEKVTGTHECDPGLDTSDATATASDILSGKTAYVNGKKVTGSIASQAAQTITPGTADQTISSGKYLSGTQTIQGDSNLVAENIKSGVSIFGVDGSLVCSGSDTADNLHVWEKYSTSTVIMETEKSEVDLSFRVSNNYINNTWDDADYSEEIEIVDGSLSLVNPSTVTISSQATAETVIGKYAKLYVSSPVSYYRIPASATVSHSGAVRNGEHYKASQGFELSVGSLKGTFIENVCSSDGTAYPTDGEQDGYWYVYKGLLSDLDFGDGGTSAPVLQEKTVTPSESQQTVSPDSGYDGLSSVTVEKIPDSYVQPSGAISITGNGTHDVTNYASAEVNVPATGIDTSDATASASDILSGKTAYANGSKITGSIETKSSTDLTASGKTVTVPAGYYASDATKDVSTVSHPAPTVSVGSDGRITATHNQDAGYTSGGTTSAIKSMTTQAEQTITPGTSDQTIAASTYLIGTQTIKGDANLVPDNIVSGVSIFGVAGSHVCDGGLDTSDATATSADMASGVTAYVNGEKVTGSVATYDKQAGWSDRTPSATTDGKIQLAISTSTPYLFRKGVFMSSPIENFGDATASDVASGKTFTSAAGLKVTGTHECESGLDTSDATASASDILSGKTAYVNGEKVTGTHECDPGLDTSDATATASDILSGKTAYVNGKKVTGSIASQAAQTITPGTADQTISSGKYLSGTQTIQGDANLVAGNIKSGVSIFGVSGTYEGSGGSDSGIQAQHITSKSDTITISGTGTVKVWGYGYYSSSTYSKTTYAFVGDGYYAGSYYGTPSKTSATFSISGGTLSGLPSNITTLDVLVTIGI